MRKLILFMAFLLSAVCLLNAQEARTISGKVVDENGEVYECRIKPYRNSDKMLINMILR